MISILIPIYNRDARSLVKELIHQADQLGIEYEILCYDSHSIFYKDKNILISNYPNCKYVYLPEDIGYQVVRNRLAYDARYDYLLFLDSDLKIDYHDFLKNYIRQIPKTDLACGGIHYLPWSPPQEYMLHWRYGVHREVKKSMQNGYFLSCNFMIRKSLFEEVKFNEDVREYGHEDSVFAVMLNRLNINRTHVFSPVAHNNLEHTDIFIERTRTSMFELSEFLRTQSLTYSDCKGIDLLRFYVVLKKLKLTGIFAKMFMFFIRSIEYNLTGIFPNLLLFDVYRIGFLCHYLHKKRPQIH